MKNKAVKLSKLNKKTQEELKINIEKHFKLNNLQTYFPPMTYWEDFENNSYYNKLFILDSKYKLISLERKSDKSDSDLDYLGYIQKRGDKKPIDKKIKHEIHFKINPLLEPINTIMNKYQLQSSMLMPSVFDYITNKKINSPHNFSYVETLFSYLASGLVENGKCPSFPYYYGSYLGVMEEFKHNISDEYDSIKKHSWFSDHLGKLFELEKISIESEIASSIPNLPEINIDEQKNKDAVLGVEEVDFDSIDITKIIPNKNKRRCSTSDNDDNEAKDDEDDDNETAENAENDDDEDDDDDEDEDEDDEEDGESEWESVTESSEEGSTLDNMSDNTNDIFDEEIDESYHYVKLKNFPVQLIAMEKLNKTLDELLKIKKLNDEEWLSILFQIIFGLAVAQKHFNFTHNDLHSSNIMFKPTKISNLYFCIKGTYYRIPTFGKITKIIDFARGIFKVDNNQFFSDVFKKDGDAEGQYTYPYQSSTHIKHSPNPSFDLSYLAITIREHFTQESPIYELLEKWVTDKYGNNLGHHNIDFDLYVKIAHNVNSAVPREQFNDSLFNNFKIKKDKIPKEAYIYYY
jgi:hypothetical protein